MNLPPFTCNLTAPHHAEVSDWISGDARRSAQPLGIERFDVIGAAHDEDAANDWIPL